jgi:hypothetical protein
MASNLFEDIAEELPSSDYDFPAPAEWMLQIEKVIDSYKAEVEDLRAVAKAQGVLLTRVYRDVEALKAEAEREDDE